MPSVSVNMANLTMFSICSLITLESTELVLEKPSSRATEVINPSTSAP